MSAGNAELLASTAQVEDNSENCTGTTTETALELDHEKFLLDASPGRQSGSTRRQVQGPQRSLEGQGKTNQQEQAPTKIYNGLEDGDEGEIEGTAIKPLQRPCVPKPATRPRDSRGLRRPTDTRKGWKYRATAGTTRQPTREQTNENRIIDQRGQRANRVPSKMKIQEQDVELHEILLDQRAAHPHWEAGRSSSHATPKQELKHRASLYYG